MNIGDPKPEKREKNSKSFVNPNKVKKYKCWICKTTFEMKMWLYAERSKTPLKSTCEDPGCKSKALIKRIVEPQIKLKQQQKRKSRAKEVRDNWDREQWKSNMQRNINWIVRELDKKYPCIAR